MSLKNGDIIKLHYTEISDGNVVATTDADVAKEKGIYDPEFDYSPKFVILGMDLLVKGLEEDLVGKDVGYAGSVEVPPEKAHGPRKTELVELIPIKHFKENKPIPGVRVSVDGKMGTINRIIGRKVSVDFNHPLAGKTVTFDYNILEEITDPEQKVSALIKIFARADFTSRIKDKVVEIDVPWELSYYQGWFTVRRGLADLILKTIGAEKVVFMEAHTGEQVKVDMVSPPSKENEDQEQNAADEKPGEAEEVSSTNETPSQPQE